MLKSNITYLGECIEESKEMEEEKDQTIPGGYKKSQTLYDRS